MPTRHAKVGKQATGPTHDPHPAPPLPPPCEVPAPPVDVAACFLHLVAAIEHLARAQGSPSQVMTELDALRALIGKEN